MKHATNISLVTLAVVVLGASTALAQSSGASSSGGASSAGSRGGSVGTMAPRVGTGTGSSIGAFPGTRTPNPTAPIGRLDPGSSGGGTGANDPRSLSTQPATSAQPGSTAPGTIAPDGTSPPAGTTTPSGTAYPSGPPLEAARQRAMQGGAGAIPPAAAGANGDRSRTSDVGTDADVQDATPGLPNQADPNRGDPGAADRAAGGSPRQGAVGKNMAECEAAWDAKTHMSKETWRTTCRRTLTQPHL